MIERAQIYAWSIQPIGKTPPIFIGLYVTFQSLQTRFLKVTQRRGTTDISAGNLSRPKKGGILRGALLTFSRSQLSELCAFGNGKKLYILVRISAKTPKSYSGVWRRSKQTFFDFSILPLCFFQTFSTSAAYGLNRESYYRKYFGYILARRKNARALEWRGLQYH